LCVFPSTFNNLAMRCDGALEQTVTKWYFNTFHYYILSEFIHLVESCV
jgi:hypothetical protein